MSVATVEPAKARASTGRPPWMEPPSRTVTIARTAVLIGLAVAMVFPFVYVAAVSFSSYRDVVGSGLIVFPSHPTLEAYNVVFRGGIVTRALAISLGVTIVGTLVSMLLTVGMAYGLSRPSVPGSRIILAGVLFTLIFSAGLIPNYLLVKQLGLLNNYASLVLPGAIAAFNLVVVRQFFMSIPPELLESARIDGANDLWILLRIVLPLSKPVLAVIALFYGVGYWNEFFAATLYLNQADMWPIQLVLRQYVLQGSALLANGVTPDPSQPPPPAQTIQMAVVVVATVPILVVYPFLQRFFTKGVLAGAIKG